MSKFCEEVSVSQDQTQGLEYPEFFTEGGFEANGDGGASVELRRAIFNSAKLIDIETWFDDVALEPVTDRTLLLMGSAQSPVLQTRYGYKGQQPLRPFEIDKVKSRAENYAQSILFVAQPTFLNYVARVASGTFDYGRHETEVTRVPPNSLGFLSRVGFVIPADADIKKSDELAIAELDLAHTPADMREWLTKRYGIGSDRGGQTYDQLAEEYAVRKNAIRYRLRRALGHVARARYNADPGQLSRLSEPMVSPRTLARLGALANGLAVEQLLAPETRGITAFQLRESYTHYLHTKPGLSQSRSSLRLSAEEVTRLSSMVSVGRVAADHKDNAAVRLTECGSVAEQTLTVAHYGIIYSLARKYSSNGDLDELFQAGFMKFQKVIRRLDQPAVISRGYLVAAIESGILDALRVRRARSHYANNEVYDDEFTHLGESERIIADENHSGDDLEQQTRRELGVRAMSILNGHLRELRKTKPTEAKILKLLLLSEPQLSSLEIAGMVGRSEGAVKAFLHRWRQKLIKELAEEGR